MNRELIWNKGERRGVSANVGDKEIGETGYCECPRSGQSRARLSREKFVEKKSSQS